MPLDVPFSGYYWYLYDDNCATLACSVLFIADYLDTLPMEVNMFWTRKSRPRVSLPAVLFFIGRYSTLLSLCMGISSMAFGFATDSFCIRTQYLASVVLQLSVACTCALLLMRAWAICRRNPWILLSGTTLILARLGYGLYAHMLLVFPAAYASGPVSICEWAPWTEAHAIKLRRYEFTVPFLALVFDTLVLAAIVTPTFRLILEMRKLRQVGFIERIVRDGVLYYIVVLILDICMTKGNFSDSKKIVVDPLYTFQWIISPFFNPIPNMLASRIVLNAHAYYHECDHSTSIQSGGEACRELEFSRFVGGIGAPMRSRLYGDDLETETEGAEVVSETNVLDELDTSDIARRDISMESGPISSVPAADEGLRHGQMHTSQCAV